MFFGKKRTKGEQSEKHGKIEPLNPLFPLSLLLCGPFFCMFCLLCCFPYISYVFHVMFLFVSFYFYFPECMLILSLLYSCLSLISFLFSTMLIYFITIFLLVSYVPYFFCIPCKPGFGGSLVLALFGHNRRGTSRALLTWEQPWRDMVLGWSLVVVKRA